MAIVSHGRLEIFRIESCPHTQPEMHKDSLEMGQSSTLPINVVYMLKALKTCGILAILGYLSVNFFSCGVCDGDDWVIKLGTQTIRAYDGQERFIYSFEPADSTGPVDTVELFIKENKTVFIEPVEATDPWFDFRNEARCVTYVEAHYVHMASEDSRYTLQHYQFAGDEISFMRGVGFTFTKNGEELLTLPPTSYNTNSLDSTRLLKNGFPIVHARYRSDSGVTTTYSDFALIKRIK